MAREGSYHRLTVAAKQARIRERMREPSVACPFCETQTTVAELVRHVDALCSGKRAPHPLSEWVAWRDALALGVPPATLSRWVAAGKVRTRGERDRREYLLRDLVLLEVGRRRCGSTIGTVPPVEPEKG